MRGLDEAQVENRIARAGTIVDLDDAAIDRANRAVIGGAGVDRYSAALACRYDAVIQQRAVKISFISFAVDREPTIDADRRFAVDDEQRIGIDVDNAFVVEVKDSQLACFDVERSAGVDGQ